MNLSSRRDALRSAAIATAVLLRRPTTLIGGASQSSTPVNFKVPRGACDCHTHIFGDPRRFPYVPERTYTPESASVRELRALHHALHVDRVVLVQPSVYGTDNACMLAAIRQLGQRSRGVAVIDAQASPAELDALDRGGVRGIRLNLATAGQTDPESARQRFQAAVERLRGRPWHIQMYTQLSVIDALQSQIMTATVPVVFDHFGAAQSASGLQQPGFDALLKLVQSGKAYVKISAPYRSSTQGPDYPDVAPLAKALIAANPQRILWGTDWPHPDSSRVAGRKATDIAPLYPIDDGRVFSQLAAWVTESAQRQTILVENPARLYGF